jgi:hypothetical protein
MDKKTAIAIIRQFVSVFESKKEFEWLVEAMIFIDKLVEDQEKEIEEYQKCFEDIERHQKNQMQMQKNFGKD